MSRFYFAWVDPDETETDLAREDEEVFSFSITHQEGEFPTLELIVRNPRVGLLGPGRKRWAILSHDSGSGPSALFYGRLVGVPQSLAKELLSLTFVARPYDFENIKAELAETLKEAPYYDPVFLTEAEREDPDAVLKARPALWHIDRVTHEVTVSDILTGEDGTVTIDQGTALYDGLDVSFTGQPARAAVVNVMVGWAQSGQGTVDITRQVTRAFANASTYNFQDVYGATRPGHKRNIYL